MFMRQENNDVVRIKDVFNIVLQQYLLDVSQSKMNDARSQQILNVIGQARPDILEAFEQVPKLEELCDLGQFNQDLRELVVPETMSHGLTRKPSSGDL